MLQALLQDHDTSKWEFTHKVHIKNKTIPYPIATPYSLCTLAIQAKNNKTCFYQHTYMNKFTGICITINKKQLLQYQS